MDHLLLCFAHIFCDPATIYGVIIHIHVAWDAKVVAWVELSFSPLACLMRGRKAMKKSVEQSREPMLILYSKVTFWKISEAIICIRRDAE